MDKTTSDDELIERLQAAMVAASDGADERHGAPTADAQDLDRRLRAGSARRDRVLTAVAAGLILLAGIGAFLLGRGAGDDDGPSDAAMNYDANGGEAAEGGAVAADREASGGADGAAGTGETSSDSFAPDSMDAPESASVPPSEEQASTSDLEAGAAAPLFVRTLGDGTELDVRTYGASVEGSVTPCAVVGDVYVGVRAPDAVGQVRVPRVAGVPADRLVVYVAVVGVEEGSPRWVVVVQAGDGVASVRATFPGGEVDEAPTTDGVAVLSMPTDPSLGPDPASAEPTPGELVVDGVGTDPANPVARWTGTRQGDPAQPTC